MSKTPLTAAPREIKARYGEAPSYRALYLAVLDGKIPADQQLNGRYLVDVDVVAKAFGLTEKVAA
jgi:hypothetical protein